MKNFTIYDPVTGEIVRIGSCPDADYSGQAQAAESIIEGQFDAQGFYIANGEAVAKTARPGDNYIWDAALHDWLPDLARARASAKGRIEAEQARLDNSIILYDDKALDAHKTARDNIHGKLAELVAAEALGETVTALVWRDADNITHGWATAEAYKTWLQGLVMAISSRSTNLYIAAWTHKAQIEALASVPDIENYDVGGGWQ